MVNGSKRYGFIDYIHDKIFAILIPFKVLPVSGKEHFSISIPVPITPVQDDPVEVFTIDCIITKCLFIKCETHSYVVEFPWKLHLD